MRIEIKLLLLSSAIVGIAASCGGRSGTELYEPEDASATGGSSGTGGSHGVVDGSSKDVSYPDVVGTDSHPPDASLDASVDGSLDASIDTLVDGPNPVETGPDGKDFFDTLPPLPDSGPIGECVGCLQSKCGTVVNTCYNDPECWKGIQCALPQCFTGGGTAGSGGSGGGGQVDMQCMQQCFNGDMTAMLEALQVFQCITQNCQQQCIPGGTGGSGGSGGNAGGAGSPISFGVTGVTHVPMFGPRRLYVGSVRVPEPEEVVFVWPWLADVLEGRTPRPMPPTTKPPR